MLSADPPFVLYTMNHLESSIIRVLRIVDLITVDEDRRNFGYSLLQVLRRLRTYIENYKLLTSQ